MTLTKRAIRLVWKYTLCKVGRHRAICWTGNPKAPCEFCGKYVHVYALHLASQKKSNWGWHKVRIGKVRIDGFYLFGFRVWTRMTNE